MAEPEAILKAMKDFAKTLRPRIYQAFLVNRRPPTKGGGVIFNPDKVKTQQYVPSLSAFEQVNR